jgi:hypothetical protein
MLRLSHRVIRWILLLIIRLIMLTFLLNLQLFLAGGIQTLLRMAHYIPQGVLSEALRYMLTKVALKMTSSTTFMLGA